MPLSFSIPVPWTSLVAGVHTTYERRNAAARFHALVEALARSVATGRWDEADKLVQEGGRAWAYGWKQCADWDKYQVLAERARLAQWNKCPELVLMHQSAVTRQENPHLDFALPALPDDLLPQTREATGEAEGPEGKAIGAVYDGRRSASPSPQPQQDEGANVGVGHVGNKLDTDTTVRMRATAAASPAVAEPERHARPRPLLPAPPPPSHACLVQAFETLHPRPRPSATPALRQALPEAPPQAPLPELPALPPATMTAAEEIGTASTRAAPDPDRMFRYNVKELLQDDPNSDIDAVDEAMATVASGAFDGLPTSATHGWTPLNTATPAKENVAQGKPVASKGGKAAAGPSRKPLTPAKRSQPTRGAGVTSGRGGATVGQAGKKTAAVIANPATRRDNQVPRGRTLRRRSQDVGEEIAVAPPKPWVKGFGIAADPIHFPSGQSSSDGDEEYAPLTSSDDEDFAPPASSDDEDPIRPLPKRRRGPIEPASTPPTPVSLPAKNRRNGQKTERSKAR